MPETVLSSSLRCGLASGSLVPLDNQGITNLGISNFEIGEVKNTDVLGRARRFLSLQEKWVRLGVVIPQKQVSSDRNSILEGANAGVVRHTFSDGGRKGNQVQVSMEGLKGLSLNLNGPKRNKGKELMDVTVMLGPGKENVDMGMWLIALWGLENINLMSDGLGSDQIVHFTPKVGCNKQKQLPERGRECTESEISRTKGSQRNFGEKEDKLELGEMVLDRITSGSSEQ